MSLDTPGTEPRFMARPMHRIECTVCHEEADAEPSLVRRWDDLDDAVVRIIVTCPSCGEEGQLLLTAGEHAPGEDAGVLAALLD